ncbi:MAG: zinc-binding dehydrogenase [Chloroflexota bacterium]|nr:zinc-binding dehydrogenase [Chloroflexota bacterium]MDE2918812.1 zinc-binding dehydrogenase [Chloroflexota bacterium]
MAADSRMTCVRCPGDLRVEVGSAEIAQPGPGEMRVRTMMSAICGSDLHHYRTPAATRDENGFSQWALGHENTGIVDAVGPGVGYPAVGDRVVVYGIVGCGHCVHCRRGEDVFCANAEHFSRHRHGTNAAYLLAPARNAMPLPDDFDWEMGALLSCNVGTAYGALRKTEASGDRPLAVFGLGPVGLSCVMLGRALGATVIGVDPVAERRAMALRCGAEAVLDSSDPDLIARIVKAAGGEGAAASIDTSGQPTARGAAVDALRTQGTYVEVGVGHDPTIRPSQQIIFGEVILRGSWIYKQHEWNGLLDLVRRRQVPIKEMITHRFRPEDAVEAFELANGATAGKILFDWS